MLRTVNLHGKLKKQFGAKHRFDVATAAEALRALNCAFPGEFVAALQVGSYSIVRGDKRIGARLDLDLVNQLKLGLAELHIIPVAAGAGNGKGVAKTIVGAVLVGSAIFFSGGALAAPLTLGSTSLGMTWGSVAAVGLGVALSGAASLMAKASKTEDRKRDESFTTAGPTNGAQQGSAIPLIYGEVITGSVLISSDTDIEDIGAYQNAAASLGSSVQAVSGPDGAVTIFGGA